MEKSVFKEILPPSIFFSTKYTKNIIKYEITSIHRKNWTGIKWPFLVDMPENKTKSNILWDSAIQTNIVVKDDNRKTNLLIDMSVSIDNNISLKDFEEINTKI